MGTPSGSTTAPSVELTDGAVVADLAHLPLHARKNGRLNVEAAVCQVLQGGWAFTS